MRITITELMSYSPCWKPARIDRLAQGRIEIDLVDLLQDKRISRHDRIWVACMCLANKDRGILRRFTDVFCEVDYNTTWSGHLAFVYIHSYSTQRDLQITWLLNELEATTLYADGRVAGERVAS